MRRAFRVVACVTAALAFFAGAFFAGASAASADTAGVGVQRWSAQYAAGAPAVSNAEALSPDGSTVFVTGGDGFGPGSHETTLAYDAATGASKWRDAFPAAPGKAYSRGQAITTSPDGSTVYVSGDYECRTCSVDFTGVVTIAYDAATGHRRWLARYPADDGGFSIAVSPDGSKVFIDAMVDAPGGAPGTAGAQTETVALDASSGQRLWAERSNAEDNAIHSLAVTASTVYVVGEAPAGENGCYQSGGYDVTAYNMSTGATAWTSHYEMTTDDYLCGQPGALTASPDGSAIYVTGAGGTNNGVGGGNLGTVALDAHTGAQLWSVQNTNIGGDVDDSLAVSPDGSRLIVGTDDCAVLASCNIATLAYDATTGGPLWTTRYNGGGSSYAGDVALSHDGTTIFVTGTDQVGPSVSDAPVIAYDASSGDERWITTYADTAGEAVIPSRDGSSVYLAATATSASYIGAQRVTGLRPAERSAVSCGRTCGYATARFNARSGPGAIQDSSPALDYDGWASHYSKSAVGGAYRTSSRRGDVATYRTGRTTAVAWVTRVGPGMGRARFTVDGRHRQLIDLYAARPATRTFTVSGLRPATHTVRVTVLGTKRPASRGTAVTVDAIETLSSGTSSRPTSIAEESSPHMQYDGWAGVLTNSASGGSYRHSASPQATISVSFSGRSLGWITATGRAEGRAMVTIDGKRHLIDLYRNHPSARTSLVFSGLGRGEHHVTIRPTGRKDAASRSKQVVVDALAVRR